MFTEFTYFPQDAYLVTLHRTSVNFALSVADPGFPVGAGYRAVGGGANLQGGHFLAKTHAKMKELDYVGGGVGRHVLAAPPGSANDYVPQKSSCKSQVVQVSDNALPNIDQFSLMCDKFYNIELIFLKVKIALPLPNYLFTHIYTLHITHYHIFTHL